MKIRIKGNSVRFRLTRSEVQNFCETGMIEQCTHFNTAVFSYSVKSDQSVDRLSADFTDNGITLLVPANDVSDWAVNDKVGFEHTLRLENGKELLLLLEKDFACLDNTTEDQTDNYPNPKAE